MELNWIDKLGDWNPQMVRELKGRLKLRNLVIAVAISLMGQLLLVLNLLKEEYSVPVNASVDEINNYEQQWWLDIFRFLSWSLPLVLLIGGVYMLISDLAKEERRGTLNFIRLSPESSQNILTGKILGVPVLLCLATALAMPLHWLSAIKAGVPLGFVLSFYGLLGVAGCFFFCAALLYALMGGLQAWVGSVLACVLLWPCISVIDLLLRLAMDDSDAWREITYMGLEEWQWFYLPIGNPLAIAYSLMLLTGGLATYWLWRVLNSRFRNPSTTLIGKRQSYVLVTCFEVFLLGFVLPETNLVPTASHLPPDSHLVIGCYYLFILTPFCFLALIAALSPHRQTLQDWARYRTDRVSTGKSFWNRSLVQDLIFGEKSPALVAIAINLAIVATIWVPWILLWPQQLWPQEYFPTRHPLLGLLITINLILIYAAIAQLMLLMKTQKRTFWAAGTVGAVIILPLVILGVLAGFDPMKMPFLWMFSPLAVVSLSDPSAITVLLGLLSQWSILGLLSWQLKRQIQRFGESATKAMLAGG